MSKGIVYCCHNIKTGKKYIGQTIRNLQERINQHISHGKRLSHIKFYRSIKKYGWDNFIWGIIEECDISILNEREKYWIKYYNTFENGYNSTLGGEGGIDPNKCKYYKLIDPEGNLVEGYNVRKLCREYNISNEIYNVLMGKSKSCQGWTLPKTKRFELISPEGKTVKFTTITIFCKEHDLSESSISKLLKGKINQHKGWRLHPIEEKIYTLKHKTGVMVKIKNVREFCKNNNLRNNVIEQVLQKEVISHKGWHLPEVNLDKRKDKNSKEFTIKSPDGKIVIRKNISKFCQENNLYTSGICNVLSGKYKQHKGWTLP